MGWGTVIGRHPIKYIGYCSVQHRTNICDCSSHGNPADSVHFLSQPVSVDWRCPPRGCPPNKTYWCRNPSQARISLISTLRWRRLEESPRWRPNRDRLVQAPGNRCTDQTDSNPNQPRNQFLNIWTSKRVLEYNSAPAKSSIPSDAVEALRPKQDGVYGLSPAREDA
jgi:hypothetical protein